MLRKIGELQHARTVQREQYESACMWNCFVPRIWTQKCSGGCCYMQIMQNAWFHTVVWFVSLVSVCRNEGTALRSTQGTVASVWLGLWGVPILGTLFFLLRSGYQFNVNLPTHVRVVYSRISWHRFTGPERKARLCLPRRSKLPMLQ